MARIRLAQFQGPHKFIGGERRRGKGKRGGTRGAGSRSEGNRGRAEAALRIPVFDRVKRETQEGHVAPERGQGERLVVDAFFIRPCFCRS